MHRTKILDPRTENRNKPCNLSESDKLLFEHEYSHQFPAVYLSTVNNIFALRDVLYKFPQFYTELCLKRKLPLISRIKRFSLLFMKSEIIPKGIWAIDDWSQGYFHWISDVLPRLWVSRKYLHEYTILLPRKFRTYPYISESLKLLGWRFHFYNSERKVKINELIIPDYLGESGHYHSIVMKELRSEFLDAVKRPIGNNRLFISRENAATRKLINQQEINKFLDQYGFQTVFPEKLTFVQQVELFQQASVVMGVHGAGLANMLFMHPGTKVIELRREGDTHNNCYYNLASSLNLDYYYLNCRSTGKYTQTADFKIELSQLEQLVSSL